MLSPLRTLIKYRDYRPQKITLPVFWVWLRQFEIRDWPAAFQLLDQVIYFTESKTQSVLVRLNRDLLKRLREIGINNSQIIYVQIHDPGSSSPVMLNLLRDSGRLENKNFKFIDSNNVSGFSDLTKEISDGVIVYVDDFAGSGDQFLNARKFFADHFIGSFSEFFLLPSICEEAYNRFDEAGVTPITSHLHTIEERPLFKNSNCLNEKVKCKILQYCKRIHSRWGLGYRNMATMVIFYRNSPTSVPLVFRGDVGQKKWKGLFPRTTDLG